MCDIEARAECHLRVRPKGQTMVYLEPCHRGDLLYMELRTFRNPKKR